MVNEIVITFDEYSKQSVLNALGIRNNAGSLTDSSGVVIKNSRGEKIKHSEFGGVLQGSKIFIKNNTDEILEYFYSQI